MYKKGGGEGGIPELIQRRGGQAVHRWWANVEAGHLTGGCAGGPGSGRRWRHVTGRLAGTEGTPPGGQGRSASLREEDGGQAALEVVHQEEGG